MILTIAEDFTNTVTLDSELTSIPDSGMYLNDGVHASITLNNLLKFLPNIDFTFVAFAAGTTYGKFTDSRSRNDIVSSGGKVYQSKVAANLGNDPASSPTQWLETDIDSLRIKTFALNSQNNAINKLNLTRRSIDSQYLYNLVEVTDEPTSTTLPNDFAAWVFEPKGSDYVKFTINEVALQATTATPQNLYVINQGVLITTLTLNPNAEGRLVFEDIDYTFSGKGKWIFAIDSQVVLTNGAQVDPLKFNGFVAYTASGIGATPESADYSIGTSNNGLSFNIKAFLDPAIYLKYNLVDFSNYLQAAWELDVLNLFLHNSNARSNRDQRNTLDRDLLMGETKDDKSGGSVLSRFKRRKREAISKIGNTFDKELVDKDSNSMQIFSTSP